MRSSSAASFINFEDGYTRSRPPHIPQPLTKYEYIQAVIQVHAKYGLTLHAMSSPANQSTNLLTNPSHPAEQALLKAQVTGTVTRKVGNCPVAVLPLQSLCARGGARRHVDVAG